MNDLQTKYIHEILMCSAPALSPSVFDLVEL
jgi:hypothetical protein